MSQAIGLVVIVASIIVGLVSGTALILVSIDWAHYLIVMYGPVTVTAAALVALFVASVSYILGMALLD